MRFEPAGTGPQEIQRYAELFAQCFPQAKKLNAQYLTWLYVENPSGPVIGFDAFDGERLIAHYAVVPVSVELAGKKYVACWSLNTATHPNYQGRGLFAQLAEHTYQAAREHGCIGVIGVANQNSTHGFIKRLGFTLHGQLSAQVGFGVLRRIPTAQSMRRIWTDELLEWRLRNPSQVYYKGRASDSAAIYAVLGVSRTAVLLDYAESSLRAVRTLKSLPVVSALQPRLLISFGASFDGIALPIPRRALPSPWNVIFRPLDAIAPDQPGLTIFGIDLDTF